MGISARWKYAEGHERIIVNTIVVLAFILIVSMVMFIYQTMLQRDELQMQSNAERSFNSVYMALREGTQQGLATMKEEGVNGIGIYNSNGTKYLELGEVPDQLPLEKFLKSKKSTADSTRGIYIYNDETGMIEYLRLSRLNVLLDTGDLQISDSGFLSTPVIFPEILYIVFDGTAYQRRLAAVKIFTVVAIIILFVFFLVILNIFQNNMDYREALAKQKNLVSLGAAARTLTHEIKNPLSAITIQLALMKKILPKEYNSELDLMKGEVERLTTLTNRVSEFLRNPLGNPEEVELRKFLVNLSTLFSTPVKFTENSLKSVKVKFDLDRLRSVFENLIKNAVESEMSKEDCVEIDLSITRKKMVKIKIMDRGKGLPTENKQSIFDPFFTTKIYGSGIGLAISKQFVEAQGGIIRLYSRDGGGTIAEVMLNRY